MANPTILDFKKAVAGQLGKTNATIQVPKREEAIRGAIRQYIGERAWRWNERTTTIVISGGYGSLPSDFSILFEPKVYTYSGATKTTYDPVELDDIGMFSSVQHAYAVDPYNSRLYCSIDTTITVKYQRTFPTLLLDTSDDSTTLPFPDQTTPVKLAIAMYWLAAERDEDEFDRFTEQVYKPLLRRDKLRDGRSGGPYRFKDRLGGADLGWNRRGTGVTLR